jgi:hypothetical protein
MLVASSQNIYILNTLSGKPHFYFFKTYQKTGGEIKPLKYPFR